MTIITMIHQVQEIIELKKALAKTRQDLQKTRSRRQSQDNRSSSDEVSVNFSLVTVTALSLAEGIPISNDGLFVPGGFMSFKLQTKQCLNNARHLTQLGSCLLSLCGLLKTFTSAH